MKKIVSGKTSVLDGFGLSKYKQSIEQLILKGKAFDGNVQWKYILKSKFGSNGERHLDHKYLVSDKFAAMEFIRKGSKGEDSNAENIEKGVKGFKLTKDEYRPF